LSLDGIIQIKQEKQKFIKELENLIKIFEENSEKECENSDKFLIVMKPFVIEIKNEASKLEDKIIETNRLFSEVLNYYAESNGKKNLEEFLSVLNLFFENLMVKKRKLKKFVSILFYF
jgi:hypothetical protein